MMRHIFLYGPPGSGKSTAGRLLSANLKLPFIDLDTEIVKTSGNSINQIITGQGEPAFRTMEAAELEKAVTGPPSVIALGGGALLRESSRFLADSTGDVVILETDIPTIIDRMMAEPDQRPGVAGNIESKLRAILEIRKAHYDSFKLRISNTHDMAGVTAWDIQQALGRFHVHTSGSGYDVVIQKGGLDWLGELMKERDFGKMIVVVADSNVGPLYGERVLESLDGQGFKTNLLTIPAGEQYKTLKTVSSLWHGFLGAGLDRNSTVVALGGGVTGDLSGFAASTFLRGIPWVGVPTSVLAMVDSSIGGKTACDLPEGKNLIGAFHFPGLVLSDPDTLATLPDEEVRSGLGEVVKHGVVGDRILFQLCGRGFDAVKVSLSEIIRRAMAVKIKIIEADPLERGLRATLNFGHTIGHALETASNYRLRHGEAVAIGMVAEARLAERLGLANSGLSEAIEVTLNGLGLPVRIPSDLHRSDVRRAISFDKKKDKGVVRFALPVSIGEIRYGVDVKDLNMIMSET
jgi:shikimate kinase / 3-dehydroquinate synthase